MAWFTDPGRLFPLVRQRLTPGGVFAFSQPPAIPGAYGPQGMYKGGFAGKAMFTYHRPRLHRQRGHGRPCPIVRRYGSAAVGRVTERRDDGSEDGLSPVLHPPDEGRGSGSSERRAGAPHDTEERGPTQAPYRLNLSFVPAHGYPLRSQCASCAAA